MLSRDFDGPPGALEMQEMRRRSLSLRCKPSPKLGADNATENRNVGTTSTSAMTNAEPRNRLSVVLRGSSVVPSAS